MNPSTPRNAALALTVLLALTTLAGCRTTVVQPVQREVVVKPVPQPDHHDDHHQPPPPPDHHDDHH